MPNRICFVDTETTSLRPDRRVWEIGIIAEDHDGTRREHHWFVNADDLDLGNADLMSLRIGRFHERHPQVQLDGEDAWTEVTDEDETLLAVEAVTRGAHLCGAVVSFDAEVLAARMRAHGICPSWHYHLCDVEALAVGYLNGKARHYQDLGERVTARMLLAVTGLPWKSDDLSAALGITVSEDERHTALGDARWAMAIYDAVTT